jgi:hypothetical protein
VTGQFRRSSAVEQLTVNQLVVGSIPTAGANFPPETAQQTEASAEKPAQESGIG